MSNKAKGAVIATLKNGAPITDLPMFNSQSGEMNAYDKGEALRNGQKFMQMMASGEILLQSESASAQNREDRIREGNALIMEAHRNPTAWASLGSSIMARIEDRAERSGFMRNLLVGTSLRQGEIARVELKQHICQAVVATGPTDLGYQSLRAKVFNPVEFELKADVRVSVIDIHQVAGDLMGRAERDAQNSIVTKEDRLLWDAMQKTIGRGNPMTYLYGGLTPGHLSKMRDQIDSWNIPVAGSVLSSDFWTDMVGNSVWMEALEPVTRHELLMTGRLATLLGMDLSTDGFRDPTQRVLPRGAMFTYATPEYLGAYSTRGAPTAEPTTGVNEGNTDKGWLVSEILSFVLANCRSVSLAQRA
jgi:hypothetical protein